MRALLAMLLLSSVVLAQQAMDQGRPGVQGPWPVTTLSSDGGFILVNQGTPPWVVATQAADGGVPFARVMDGTSTTVQSIITAGTAHGTPNAPMCLVSDGTNALTQRADTSGRAIAVGTAAVGAAVAGNPVMAGASDGTNAQYLKVDSSTNLLSSLGTRLAGENLTGTRAAITDWMETYKAGTYTTTPAKTTTTVSLNATACTTAGGASCTIVYASTEWLTWPNLTITVRNTGANALTNGLVEWSPDGTSFEVWDSTSLAGLAAGATKSVSISGNSRRYLRLEAQSASGTTTDVWITANQN